jgi:23S rRNA (cytidine2498-2'-O)-methyltransferase
MIGYLAPKDYLEEVRQELEGKTQIEEVYDRLILTSGPVVPSIWAQNIWLNTRKIPIQSISHAAQELKAIQRNWSLYSVHSHRRAQLITEKLPKISAKTLDFPITLPTNPMGSWSLVENDLIIASPECTSLFPNGELYFQENKIEPPSRAYLKLWEALTLVGDRRPGPSSHCLDMGSCPGGWTWVLQKLGAQVISVDKAPLDARVAALPGVRSLHQDAFTLDPKTVGPVDWFFSDVICYPQKLLELVQKWFQTSDCRNYICTIKFQGQEMTPADQAAIRGFMAIPGSRVCHLFNNKHELTCIK